MDNQSRRTRKTTKILEKTLRKIHGRTLLGVAPKTKRLEPLALPRFLLRLLLSKNEAEIIEGDLLEGYERDLKQFGRPRALWLAYKQVTLSFKPLIKRLFYKSGSRIHKAPGARLLVLVNFLYAPKTVENVFKPIVADWRTEYFETLNDDNIVKARWISTRYRYGFFMAMMLVKIFSFYRRK